MAAGIFHVYTYTIYYFHQAGQHCRDRLLARKQQANDAMLYSHKALRICHASLWVGVREHRDYVAA